MLKTFAEITAMNINILGNPRKYPFRGLPIVVLFTNVRYVTIRVADIKQKPPAGKFSGFLQGLFGHASPTPWELVKSHFPIGDKMNEQTHIFDGTVFENKDEKRYLMAAIPIEIAEKLAASANNVFGRISRLDVVETALFRYFSSYNEDLWVVFPQCDGFCVLHMTDGLPRAAWNISNHLYFRRDELERNLLGGTYRRPAPHARRIYLLEAGAELMPEVKSTQSTIKTAPTRAVILETDDADTSWMYDIFEENDIAVEMMDYMAVLEQAVKQH